MEVRCQVLSESGTAGASVEVTSGQGTGDLGNLGHTEWLWVGDQKVPTGHKGGNEDYTESALWPSVHPSELALTDK